jgi:hypothetical protein
MFGWLTNAWHAVTGKIDSTIAGWVHDVVNGLYSFLHIIFGDVGKAWNDLVGYGVDFIHGVEDFGTYVGNALEHLYKVWIPDIIKWVTTEIYDPLVKAVDWIAHEGATMWHYISHPADLVDLIWDDVLAKLESDAVYTAEVLGKWFLTLIVKNADEFARMIEDIIDAIF